MKGKNMKLITKELQKNIPAIYSTEEIPLNDKIAVAKFFNPCGAGTWYVIEGQVEDDGDFLCFGLVDLHEKEFGYFSVGELESIRLPFGLTIERDLHFVPKAIGEIRGDG